VSLLTDRAEARRQAEAAEGVDRQAVEEEYRQLVHEFGAGLDLVGRGWEEPHLVEAAAGCAGSAAAAVIFGASGAVAVFVAPQAVPGWILGMAILAVGQVVAQGVAQAIRYRRGLLWWTPVREGGKVRLRARRDGAGGLEVLASRGARRAWVPSSEFAVISVQADLGGESQQD
jgi:hypothetical protein